MEMYRYVSLTLNNWKTLEIILVPEFFLVKWFLELNILIVYDFHVYNKEIEDLIGVDKI